MENVVANVMIHNVNECELVILQLLRLRDRLVLVIDTRALAVRQVRLWPLEIMSSRGEPCHDTNSPDDADSCRGIIHVILIHGTHSREIECDGCEEEENKSDDI